MVNQKLVNSLLIMPFERAAYFIELLGVAYGKEYYDKLVQAVFDEHHKKAVK